MVELTHAQALALAERRSQEILGINWIRALQLLNQGALDGTHAESVFRQLKHLIATQ